MTSTMKFRNECETLPIIVSSFNNMTTMSNISKELFASPIPGFKQFTGIEEYTSVTVLPNTEVVLTSTVGEWTLESLFYDSEHASLWKKEELRFDSVLAKISSTCFYNGKHTCNYIDDKFELVYENGIFIWRYIK